MKIVIDARFWGPSHTGLGVYTRELVENLGTVDSINSYTILVRKEMFDKIILPKNFQKLVVEAQAYTFWEQIILPIVLYRIRPDIVHFPSINVPIFYLGKYIVTIHDLIKHQSRGTQTSTHNSYFYYFKYFVYLMVTKFVVFKSSQIIVPSKAVKDEIINNFKISNQKIKVTYEAPSFSNSFSNEESLSLPVKFAIYTGNAYPHKNLERLISIWPKVFAQSKMSLVISSGRNVFSQRIQKIIEKYSAQKVVHYLGFLSDKQLAYSYSQSLLYVFPTLLEGFGLPGLDAMNLGLPVVCSDIPVLREIYGESALYFDPKNANDMQSKIIEAASDKSLRSHLIELGKEQVKKYSWQKMANETLTIYNSI